MKMHTASPGFLSLIQPDRKMKSRIYFSLLTARNISVGAFLCISMLTVPVFSQPGTNRAIYNDPKASVGERVGDLLSRMTLEEKLEQLSGIPETGFDTKENTRLGIPGFHMSDGPLGVRWDNSTAFPCGTAVAATWDTALVARFAGALAAETKAHGRNYLLGPCVNIHRLPIGGRNFESYGEDPWLASRLAVAYVRSLQANHVIPSVKHFALNNQEWRRTEVDVEVDERAMREIYLPAFEAAVKEADAWSLMSAYNKVNGWWCSENKTLLVDILKNEWGFQGLVVSDWVSTHTPEYAANNGLDLEMPYGEVFIADTLRKLIREGKVSEKTIDDKVRRILRVKFLAGLFDEKIQPDTAVLSSDEHKQLALEMAEAGTVLLKNEGNLLPLDAGKLKKIAVIGPNAALVPTGGGGSSHVSPPYSVSPLDGIKKLAGENAKVIYAQGDMLSSFPMDPIPGRYFRSGNLTGLKGEYFSNKNLSGQPVVTRQDSILNFLWDIQVPAPKMESDNYSVRWTGQIIPPVSRKYLFYTASDDGVRLYINGKKLIDNWTDHGVTVDTATIFLEAGKTCDLKVEYFENGGSAVFILGWDYQEEQGQNRLIAEAVQAAKNSDVAIVFAGSTEYIESEGYDRRNGMELAGNQAALIKAVAEANPRTIVVLNTGTPVITKTWLEKVPVLLEAFFPGQEGGNAIASILFGNYNPSGRLPFSFISGPGQSPAFKGYMDNSLKAPYSEGIFVGYRYLDEHKMTPTFPFGYGLSYTTFAYSGIQAQKMQDGSVKVKLTVRNTGKMAGTETVQLYVSDKHSRVPRPEKELKGFAKVYLKSGESKEVSVILGPRSFAYYDVEGRDWKTEPGSFSILAGSSSDDIHMTTTIDI